MILSRRMLASLAHTWMPFAEAASKELPLRQLMRLSLFQISVGMAQVLLLGTLNRVMIVEMSVPALVVAAMISIPVLVAPFRAVLGHRSDTYRSAIGWKRIPYLWFGSLWQMGGLALMPFALILLSGDQIMGPDWAGEVFAGIAFLMAGLGMHMTQTAGLALAADRATEETRPRVVALLYVMFLVGMGISALVVGFFLRDFDQITLIRVVQACGAMTLVLNVVALWKQEVIRPMTKAEREAPRQTFREAWGLLAAEPGAMRLLAVVMIGTLGFNMQDVLLEPYGGQVLKLPVSMTTLLTASWSFGALVGFIWAARRLAQGATAHRLAARGILIGIVAFTAVLLSALFDSKILFFVAALGIGLGSGTFGIATLTVAMMVIVRGASGIALGAWGAAQATAAGLAVFFGGALRDLVAHAVETGSLGALSDPALGYSVVYVTEIGLLFTTLAVLGPLARPGSLFPKKPETGKARIGLSEFPT
ncbi:MFS transporter [Rhodobacter sp. TJ_12]|uniref:PucC family protein n=1 Tax=Rhodobacter sp. TJ_12 TaxID=2029399 RepID=UPI001CBA88EF|nr:PucC family protein [Rhodobacter sp. TJ_12]MBZ4021378.1 MFS transporter [Rhodobacter sp. TJ_12]